MFDLDFSGCGAKKGVEYGEGRGNSNHPIKSNIRIPPHPRFLPSIKPYFHRLKTMC